MQKARNRSYTSKTFKRESIRTAKELGYPQSVLDRISRATSEDEISRIMTQARNDTYEREMLNESIKFRRAPKHN